MYNIKFILVVQFLFSFCLCEISNDQKEKLLNGFVEYYNGLPNQVYHSKESSLLNTQQEDETTYQIVANLRVAEVTNTEASKWLKCTATIKDSENVVSVLNSNCEDAVEQKSPDENPETTVEAQVEVSEPTVERRPVQLDNEVQADTAITSGEQFIAIPRDQPSAPCVGCATHVNPQAAGVDELASLGVRHLDLHEPGVKHTLESVIDVERQVQVVNGVRYILTLSINSNNCTEVETENCASSKICVITVLAKPWVKLSNGGNYRAILANNCTEQWLFGENGEVLPEPSTGDNPVKSDTSGDDVIRVEHNIDVQSQPNQEKTITDEDLKKIQEQIISYTQFQEVTESDRQAFTISPEPSDESKQHVFKIESERHTENSIPVTESEKTEHQPFNINLDKKKAIDDMLDFFDFSGFKPKTEGEDTLPRIRRSYDYDLQVLSLAEDFHGIKNSIENARFMYELAQAMVDYLNEMDMEVKNRAVKNVIRAEEEKENLQRFVYIQARVTIPCDKVDCESREVDTQICNGVLDCSNEKSPQILNTFCYNDNKESDYRENIREISLDDPVLLKMAEEAVKQIESKSKSQYAMRVNKIASAITQVTSGTLTKFSVIVESIKCNKSVPLPLRLNCTVLEQLGTKICDVIVHERHWLKEKKLSYTCTDRPADMRISKSKKLSKNVTVDDPQIVDMLQEAIQYLESQSEKSNKQKIVNIKSISSQIIAGFLTKIEFVVGYTDCTDENYSRDQINKCELLKGEELRTCKAQIWDRSWIMDGRQIEVSCDDVSKNNEMVSNRKKRSIDVTVKEPHSFSKDSDRDYKKLANESLYKFMQSSPSHQHYEVVKVDKAKVQDASRKLIKLDFSISPTNCLIQNGILSSSECKIVNPKNILHCRSKILENNWINKNQYFVKCKIKYQLQKNSNELKERNPNDSKYYQLAEQSLAKYLQDTDNPHHVIDRVEKVTTQLVSGLLTRIDFIVSPKNRTVNDSKPVRCHSEILEQHWLGTKAINVSCQMKSRKKIQDVEIKTDDPEYMQIAVESLQKYIKNKPESKIVRVTFVDKVELIGETIKIRFIASRVEEGDGDTLCFAEVSRSKESKRNIDVKCHFIGKVYREAEIMDDDPNYYKYVQWADESLHNYLQKMKNSLYTLVSIESVTVQWNDGIKTIINFNISPDSENSELPQGKHCIAEILEQPWLHKKKIIQAVKCELERDLYRTKRRISNVRVRRQLDDRNKIQLRGGEKEQDPTEPKYRALAEESLRKYVADSGISRPVAVAQVVKVVTQVVAGSLTKIDFRISGSSDSATIKCHSEVWEQAWLNKKEITVSCEEGDGHRGKRQIHGGEKEQDPTEPKYRALAEESLRKYVADSGISRPVAVAQVVKVVTQVVAGSLTKIDFRISGSSDSATIKCHSEVWEQAWLNKKEITVSCEEGDGHRGKRQIPGGEKEQDPTEPKYRALAEESLRKYVADSGISRPVAVAQVVKVVTQVVAGSLTKIDFRISGSSDSATIKCHSEVWEQAWLNKKEITVSCEEGDGHRGKRQIPGGEKEQDPTEPKYRALAEESLRKYVADSGISRPVAVAQVVKVVTQVVAGSLTKIDFRISGSSDSATIKCHSEVWEQAWLNKKEITVSCEEGDGHRGKRQIPGGEKEQDPTEPKYRALAEESLRKYVADSGISRPVAVAQVVKVVTQVVAGSLTKIDFRISGSSDSATIKCHSEVWEQAWLNKKEITVSCEEGDGHRGKRQIPGGEKEQDPTEPKYRALAEESLRKYVADSGISRPVAVAQVVKVVTQVVAGSLTKIDFRISGSSDSATIKCHSEVWEQAWLNKKEITVSCEEGDGHRGKRQIPGGEKEQDPTEPKYRALAEESLRKYVADSGISRPVAVAQVVKVVTQVVAGSLTKIDFRISGSSDSATIKCHSEVWEQAWLNKKEITVSCEEGDGHRGKRQIPGGEKEQDPTEPKYRALAEESLRKYVADSGISRPVAVAQVVKVVTQVVAGSLTKIDFRISGSSDSATIKCHSEVWEQAWLNKKEITVSCEEGDGHRGKRQIPGGEKEQDPTEPKYRALAEESLRKYVADSGISRPVAVAQVVKVVTQVVAGSLTKIDFRISGSSDSATIKCHSEVWEQAWLNKKEITVSCEEGDGHRGKRQIPGGEKEQDPTEPKYRALAEESLRKYVADSGISRPVAVAQVVKVVTQVVAGSLTKIDFRISGSSDSATIKCHSEVWEQAWLNKKEITVSCEEGDGHRGKRQLVGGLQDQDVTNPKYRAMAEQSLRKYTRESGTTQPHELVRIKKVSTQVVAGVLTRIDFEVSVNHGSSTIKCHSKILEQGWLNHKDITVSCAPVNGRVKRDLRMPGVWIRGNRGKNESIQPTPSLRGNDEEDKEPNKPEYRQMAQESLRKLYRKKSTVYHKVIEVQHVRIRVVAGFKYFIDFTAAPTSCLANVSSVRARSCKADDDVLLYCHTDIWDRPWLRQKKIDVQCNGPTYDNDDFIEYDADNDVSIKPTDPQNNDNEKYMKLAEEASEKYLTSSNRIYVHKVTEILSSSEQVTNGTLITIGYSLSPTTCLRNETTDNTTCKLKKPLVVFTCNANIRTPPGLNVEKEITVTCKKNNEGKKRKRELLTRKIRQTDDDDEIDEDTIYYYADRAVQHINDRSNSNNLHKLISIHAVQNSVQMGTLTVKMYIEVAETFCLRHHKSKDLRDCEEMNGLVHRLCLARLWPSPDDELVVRHVSVVCDDEEDFVTVTGVNIPELIRISIAVLESPPENKWKLIHQGEPQVIPSLDSRRPFKLNFIVALTNCSKDVNLEKNPFQCYLNPNIPPRNCRAFIWLKVETKYISNVETECTPIGRFRRSALDPENVTLDYSEIQTMVRAALEQLEMQSLHRYKQRVLQINSHSTRITSGKVTTIDFDVGYTSCLKYEWVANITSCNFLEHLPRRRCVAQIWERLWINNGKNIDVNCVDDETPLESHIEFESAEMANELARQALKHIEAKYPHPSKQKVVRIFSLEKQVVAGIHYKMKVEIGYTDCLALSDQKECKLVSNHGLNKFCRVNVWIRPWTDHPPNFRVSCDFQEGATRDLYHHVQAEHLFYNFLTTYSPSYVNEYSQMQKRFEIFKDNIKKIHELNVHEKGTAVYGVTRFADLTYEEFSSTYMGLKKNLTNENQVPMKQADIPNIKIPLNFDWREYDAVTEVKDQGSCGSCWAFSVTGNIEGQWKMQSGQLVSLSEQELVDCDKLDDGCNGGLPDNAYRAIEQMGGLELESDYPYEGTDDKCVFNKTMAKVQISSAVNITTNETGMAQWLVHNGPISIGINANAMQFYMGGISHPWKMLCNPTNLDHGVLIVGYGVKDYPLFHKKLPYWIIKNSWGKSWGEQGYYRVYRGDGTCGVNQMASSAVI
ncbi:hypothetical protein PYW08_007450 [Mythimna loreyi]|uniref:Uncharacterized protein n=1 Tax=Mythimna loreyi TaxID=667449 RepID=A0ACC2QDQ6_9NEOP|nr:hypothetical protein PYW08_007450 [Mythimna loreyi]